MKLARQQTYYPYLDLLKFVCCIGVVAIHTRPHHYMPDWIENVVSTMLNLLVPTFFMLSAYLFVGKINFNNDDMGILRRFIIRLSMLYVLWAVIMLWDWLPGFLVHNSNDWMISLPVRLLCGAAKGSWFVISLIYGMLIVYFANRWFNKWLVTIIFLTIDIYCRCVFQGIWPDSLGISIEQGPFIVSNSFVFALAPLQIGLIIRHYRIFESVSVKISGCISLGSRLLLISIIVLFFSLNLQLSPFIHLFVEGVIIILCAKYYNTDEQFVDFSLFRKMSIIIYFTHFGIATIFRFLYTKEIIGFEFGLIVFLVAIFICSLLAYILVKASICYPKLKYLY